MLAEISFGYNRHFTEAECVRIRQCAITDPAFREEFKEEVVDGVKTKVLVGYCIGWDNKTIMTLENAATFGKFSLERLIDNEAVRGLQKLEQRHTTVVNEKCNVVVPGLGLLLMDEVKAVTDLCTEQLQQELDVGWRILAICVQPDQRRPDYVLGRTKKELK